MKKLLLAMTAVAMSVGTAVAGDHKANIVVVTHGSDTDAFWGVVRNAVNAAAEDTGADVQYRNPSTGDLNEMAALIEAATAQNRTVLLSQSLTPTSLAARSRQLSMPAFLSSR